MNVTKSLIAAVPDYVLKLALNEEFRKASARAASDMVRAFKSIGAAVAVARTV